MLRLLTGFVVVESLQRDPASLADHDMCFSRAVAIVARRMMVRVGKVSLIFDEPRHARREDVLELEPGATKSHLQGLMLSKRLPVVILCENGVYNIVLQKAVPTQSLKMAF